MKLRDWLKKRWKGTKEEFAQKIGVSLMALNRYERGIRQPRLDIAIRIEKATNGEVTVEDLIPRKPVEA
jgi:transcriptional regulator with XRE-family HTH domain